MGITLFTAINIVAFQKLNEFFRHQNYYQNTYEEILHIQKQKKQCIKIAYHHFILYFQEYILYLLKQPQLEFYQMNENQTINYDEDLFHLRVSYENQKITLNLDNMYRKFKYIITNDNMAYELRNEYQNIKNLFHRVFCDRSTFRVEEEFGNIKIFIREEMQDSMIQSYHLLKMKNDYLGILEDIKELREDVKFLKEQIRQLKSGEVTLEDSREKISIKQEDSQQNIFTFKQSNTYFLTVRKESEDLYMNLKIFKDIKKTIVCEKRLDKQGLHQYFGFFSPSIKQLLQQFKKQKFTVDYEGKIINLKFFINEIERQVPFQLQEKSLNQNQVLLVSLEELKKQLTSVNVEHRKKLKKVKLNLEGEIEENKKKYSKKLEELQEQHAKYKAESSEKLKEISNFLKNRYQMATVWQLVNGQSKNIKNFQLSIRSIQYKGIEDENMQLLMKEPVKRENNNLVYVFKINSTKNRRIYIGVLDKNARINEKTSVRSPNSVCYSGFGFIFSGTEQNDIKTVKSGFKVGDVVRMKVSLEEGRIEWTVNTFNKCVQQCQFLKEDKQFVPYIQMCHKKDKITLTVQESDQ